MAFSFPFAQVGHPSCRDPRCGLRPLESHGSRWRYPAFLDLGPLNHHSRAQMPIWPSTRGCCAGLRSAWDSTAWSSHSTRFFPNHTLLPTPGSPQLPCWASDPGWQSCVVRLYYACGSSGLSVSRHSPGSIPVTDSQGITRSCPPRPSLSPFGPSRLSLVSFYRSVRR